MIISLHGHHCRRKYVNGSRNIVPFQLVLSECNIWICNCGLNEVEDEIDMLLFCPEPIWFFTDGKSCVDFFCPILSVKLLRALPIFNTCIYLYIYIYLFLRRLISLPNITWFAATYLNSAPLCWTAGLFISGCFSQTSDWNAAWNHRLPPCAPRMLCTVASSLLPSRPPGLFQRQFQTWHCAYSSAGQRWQHSPAGEVSWAAAALQNTLIISLNHCTVMGHRSCQLWWNETEDRKRARHHNGHTGRSCPSWHLYFLYFYGAEYAYFIIFFSSRVCRHNSKINPNRCGLHLNVRKRFSSSVL